MNEETKSLFQFHPLARIGWACGCWTGYPNRWYKRTRLVKWLSRFDPVEFP